MRSAKNQCILLSSTISLGFFSHGLFLSLSLSLSLSPSFLLSLSHLRISVCLCARIQAYQVCILELYSLHNSQSPPSLRLESFVLSSLLSSNSPPPPPFSLSLSLSCFHTFLFFPQTHQYIFVSITFLSSHLILCCYPFTSFFIQTIYIGHLTKALLILT